MALLPEKKRKRDVGQVSVAPPIPQQKPDILPQTYTVSQYGEKPSAPAPTAPAPAPDKTHYIDPKTGEVDYLGEHFTRAEWEARSNVEMGRGGMVTPKIEAIRTREAQLKADAEARAAGLPTSAEQAQIQQQKLRAAQGIGVLPPEGAIPGKRIGEQALSGGLSAGAMFAGAKIGAAGGTLIAPGVGTVIGGIVGGLTGLFTKLSLEKRQDVKVAKVNYDNAKTSLLAIPEAYIQGLITYEQAITGWNNNLVTIRASEKALKAETRTEVGKKLSDGLDELSDITQFYNDYELLYHPKLLAALMSR